MIEAFEAQTSVPEDIRIERAEAREKNKAAARRRQKIMTTATLYELITKTKNIKKQHKNSIRG